MATGVRAAGRRLALVASVAFLLVVVIVAALADVLPLVPYDRVVPDLGPRIGPRLSLVEPFGTDALGRSMTSRLIYGARETLVVGVLATTGAMSCGVTLGVVAGYCGRRLAALIDLGIDAMLSVPPLVLLLAVATIGRRNTPTVVIGLIIVGAPTFARLARANTLRLRRREFVTCARAMGATTSRIIGREIVPQVVLGLLSFTVFFIGAVIVVEGSLSFLGLGIPPPSPSWGGLVDDGRRDLQVAPHLVVEPAAFLVLTVLSLTAVGAAIGRRLGTTKAGWLA